MLQKLGKIYAEDNNIEGGVEEFLIPVLKEELQADVRKNILIEFIRSMTPEQVYEVMNFLKLDATEFYFEIHDGATESEPLTPFSASAPDVPSVLRAPSGPRPM